MTSTSLALAEVAQRGESPALPWSLAKRIAFRFFSLYLVLYALGGQIAASLLPIPHLQLPPLGQLTAVKAAMTWVAAHLFSIRKPLVYRSGSGDKTFDWVLMFFVLALAVLGTVLWTMLDRRRSEYVRLYAWVSLFLRFCLASQMIIYGLVKVVPLQMSFPSLTRLLERYGNFSLMGVLWASVGASPAYEIFVGCAELTAGVLLVIPALSTLGLLICLIDSVEIFALNMTYDVPVKQFSFHLIVLSAFLLGPQGRRLVNVLVLNRAAEPFRSATLFRSPRANRIAIWAQCAFGLFLVLGHSHGLRESWFRFGGGHSRSRFYGIWDVQAMKYDGKLRSPSLDPADGKLWRRLVFDLPDHMTAECMDESLSTFGSVIDSTGKTLTLSAQGKTKWTTVLTAARPAPDRMTLDGAMEGHQLHLDLKAMNLNRFLLLGSRFHWVQEFPLNR